MSKEFVFWFYAVPKSKWLFPWDMQIDLVRVVIDQHGIKSDGPMHANGNDVLDIPFSEITDIKVSLGSKGGPNWIHIDSHKANINYLLPSNPFEPRMPSFRNYDESKAFVDVVNALRINAHVELDENPYIRQSKRKDKPPYVNAMLDFAWDKNTSPWKYYFEFVPASQDRKILFAAKVWNLIMLGLLLFFAYGVSLVIYIQFTHTDKALINKLFVPTVPVAFGLLVVGLLVTVYAQWKK
jgi:hypothetical protein